MARFRVFSLQVTFISECFVTTCNNVGEKSESDGKKKKHQVHSLIVIPIFNLFIH